MQSARVVEREDVRVRKLGDNLDLAREAIAAHRDASSGRRTLRAELAGGAVVGEGPSVARRGERAPVTSGERALSNGA